MTTDNFPPPYKQTLSPSLFREQLILFPFFRSFVSSFLFFFLSFDVVQLCCNEWFQKLIETDLFSLSYSLLVSIRGYQGYGAVRLVQDYSIRIGGSIQARKERKINNRCQSESLMDAALFPCKLNASVQTQCNK